MIAIAKNHPYDILECENTFSFYSSIFYFKCNYFSEQTKNVYLFFKELMNLNIIKEKEEGSDTIEELMILEEETENYEDIINISQDFYKALKDFVRVAKEKGFRRDNIEDENTYISNFVYIVWKEFCKESVCF